MINAIRQLEADGLLLRPLSTADADAIRQACEDMLFQRWLPWRSGGYDAGRAEEFTAEYAAQRWASGEPIWALCKVSDPTALIGVLDLRNRGQGAWEIGYWMTSDARGRGWMITANHLAINAAFTALGARRIMHYARVGNAQSRKVARKLGFVPEGVRRKPVDGGVERQWQHSLLRSEWSGKSWATQAF